MADDTTTQETVQAGDLIGRQRLEEWQGLTQSSRRLRTAAGEVMQAAAGWDLKKLRIAVHSLSQEAGEAQRRSEGVRPGRAALTRTSRSPSSSLRESCANGSTASSA